MGIVAPLFAWVRNASQSGRDLLMIDFSPLIYITLIGLGLIGAQAALSDKRLMLVLSAPPPMANSGYSRDVIEDLFLGELEDVFNTASAIATPEVASVRQKTILGALADA